MTSTLVQQFPFWKFLDMKFPPTDKKGLELSKFSHFSRNLAGFKEYDLHTPVHNGNCCEEDAFGCACVSQLAEEGCKLIGLEGGAAEIASRAEGTVETVPFAGGREQGLQQEDVFSVGELRRVNEGLVFFFGCEAGGF